MVKPSPDLVWFRTDELVLRALMHHRRLTRAELATEIGISKPTAGESVRRLTERGLLTDTGERTPGGRGRGRVGSYYSLAAGVGTALAISIAPEGVVSELLNAFGDTLHRAERPARPEQVAETLREVAAEVGDRPRLAVVSAADPVDRASGRLVHLPDSPFLVGELDPVEILGPHVDGPIVVDNDVNWAARAERESAGDDFAYLFLGRGLGCALVADGEIRRGRSGLAGEIAHLITTGPDGRATPFIEVFAQLGLRQTHSTAIDVNRLLSAEKSTWEAVARAVAGVAAAAVTLADPGLILVGGSWGPSLLPAIREAVAGLPRPAPVRAAATSDQPSLVGARADAVARLRTTIAAVDGPVP